MLSRNVSSKIEQAKNPDLPFEATQKLLNSADITFGNLECPLSDSDIRIREGLVFGCFVGVFVGVINSSFDVLSTANNHSFDQGSDNIAFTIDYLKSQGILPVGTARSLSPPREREMTEEVIERNGIRFGFLGYSYSAHNDGKFSTDPQVATMDISQLKTDIAELKTKSDVIIVSMHAGAEYTRHPNQMQTDFAHAAIDAGADIILGHHPHWIQDVEVYSPPQAWGGVGGEVVESRKGLIFYSLGNFVFDQMWSQDTREGLMVKLEFTDKELKSAELIPIVIDNYCCPRLADEKEKQSILLKINTTSTLINLK